MDLKVVSKAAILAVAIPTTAILVYWLFLRDEDDEDEICSTRTVETSRQTVIRVTVPGKAVGTIIGQQGSTIKKIQEESGAKVNFMGRDQNSKGDEDRQAIIRGTTEAAQKAEVMIYKMIADMPKIITEEVEVPGYCIGRIIGKGGERIREMSRTSECKIFVDRSQDSRARHLPRIVTITGPQDQISLAKTLLAETVQEEEECRVKMAIGTANREQRKPQHRRVEGNLERPVTAALQSRTVDPPEAWDAGDSSTVKIAMASPVKEFMEVFVSACEHPGHFWVQEVSSNSPLLDKLTDDLTTFYSNDSTAEVFRVTEVKVGDVVAAPFSDRMWYRAEVVDVQSDNVDLYFIDYGDSLFLPLSMVRELRPQYLSLPMQSVECKLANVRPVGDQWTDEAIDCFETLTYCASWKVLSARTVGYESRTSGSVPCLQLFQPNDEKIVDVAAELVAQGFAVWETERDPKPTSADPDPEQATVTMVTVRPDPVPQSSPIDP